MASLQTSGYLVSSSSSSFSSKSSINAAISVPKLPNFNFPLPKVPSRTLVDELILKDAFTKKVDDESFMKSVITTNSKAATVKLYAILEAVADRVEMHKNIGEQRDNWNKLLLNSINMITLTATSIAGVASACGGAGVPHFALNLSSTLLFTAATGMLLIMNKIQPSQLAEEQRNAARLFNQLYRNIKTRLALHDNHTEMDVKDAMNKVLALDKAYPLPLMGKMIEKFPERFEPASWWKKPNNKSPRKNTRSQGNINGWNEDLEMEMREVLEVIKTKDVEEYKRLGNAALKVNKILAISGPLLTGIAAVGSAFAGHGSLAAVIAVTAGALATTVNTVEHGGQVGMVVEMYRNCAGFFSLLEESVESTLEISEPERRENGDLFETKVALKLGRSLSELRDLARKSYACRMEVTEVDEFASKLI
ncbi:probable F-box protein At4g22030 [Mercurialis annua]|uniref:probable F-box protein At4g22030 n=1 Tax=Mercurialis annua TaxID=3986 RepID=UPI00215E2CB1|nr:probable F-box protein At4g22030 [Mercurialis annua]